MVRHAQTSERAYMALRAVLQLYQAFFDQMKPKEPGAPRWPTTNTLHIFVLGAPRSEASPRESVVCRVHEESLPGHELPFEVFAQEDYSFMRDSHDGRAPRASDVLRKAISVVCTG